ncbi:uncharacterized protein LOC119107891 [Pollicipes pollicipes]|uniref:uncharacterized protein LOC119107891 n=1 Tax=Pollicipes pollicipes TaxID=41117 RepID=UPI001884D3A2|nr:uncharacterized protein LOC119107891 [Pollicipes pollicipes]
MKLTQVLLLLALSAAAVAANPCGCQPTSDCGRPFLRQSGRVVRCRLSSGRLGVCCRDRAAPPSTTSSPGFRNQAAAAPAPALFQTPNDLLALQGRANLGPRIGGRDVQAEGRQTLLGLQALAARRAPAAPVPSLAGRRGGFLFS